MDLRGGHVERRPRAGHVATAVDREASRQPRVGGFLDDDGTPGQAVVGGLLVVLEGDDRLDGHGARRGVDLVGGRRGFLERFRLGHAGHGEQ